MMLLAVRRRTWVGMTVLLLLAGAAWPSYRWWSDYRTQAFKTDCQAAADSKDWERLEELTTRWLAWDGTNGFAWLFLAEAAQQQEDFERTAECLARLSDNDPKCVPALLARVELLFGKLNRPLDAASTCERILKINPRIATPHQRLIFFYSMTLERRKLVQQIRQSIELRREPPEAYVYVFLANVLKFSNGLSVTDRWLKQYPNHEPFLVAKAYYTGATGPSKNIFEPNEGFAGDSSLMDEYLKRFPKNLEVVAFHLERSIIAGDTDRVAELLADLPAGADQDSRFWRSSGWFHAARNELAEAEAAFRQALRVNAYDWRSRHELADVLRRLGKLDEVETTVRLASKGKKFERELLELPKASEVSGELLGRLGEYAEECGDHQVADGIRERLAPDLAH